MEDLYPLFWKLILPYIPILCNIVCFPSSLVIKNMHTVMKNETHMKASNFAVYPLIIYVCMYIMLYLYIKYIRLRFIYQNMQMLKAPYASNLNTQTHLKHFYSSKIQHKCLWIRHVTINRSFYIPYIVNKYIQLYNTVHNKYVINMADRFIPSQTYLI